LQRLIVGSTVQANVAIRSSLCVAAILVLAPAGSGADSALKAVDSAPANRVTVITDSVGGVLYWVTEARENLARGLDLDLETKTCRKLVAPGCPAYGDPSPASALETIEALGPDLGPTVVIDVGYNDDAGPYGAELDTVMDALGATGVQHVVWVTLEETKQAWVAINAEIRAAPKRWPQLSIADWAGASAGKPWFNDGIHMNYDGGLAFADFLRPYILGACGQPCAPPPPLAIATALLPVAQQGKPYAVTVSGRGGAPPLRWSVLGLPRGLHLSAAGRLRGLPRAPGTWRLHLQLVDSWDQQASADLRLRVRRKESRRRGR
jgi:hypothetical protein